MDDFFRFALDERPSWPYCMDMSNNAQDILLLALAIPAVGYVAYLGWLGYLVGRAERKGY